MASSAALCYLYADSERPSKQFMVRSCASVGENTSKCVVRETVLFVSAQTPEGCNMLHSQTSNVSLTHTALRAIPTETDPLKHTHISPQWITIINLGIIELLKTLKSSVWTAPWFSIKWQKIFEALPKWRGQSPMHNALTALRLTEKHAAVILRTQAWSHQEKLLHARNNVMKCPPLQVAQTLHLHIVLYHYHRSHIWRYGLKLQFLTCE